LFLVIITLMIKLALFMDLTQLFFSELVLTPTFSQWMVWFWD